MSDSSSDECDERLREAAVTADAIVKKRPPKSVPDTGDASKDEGTNITDLSAECRNFLAKSLASTLDKQIKVVSRETDPPQDDQCDTGIRLFTDSTVQVVDIEEEPQVQPRRKKHKKSKEKESGAEGLPEHENLRRELFTITHSNGTSAKKAFLCSCT